jgi:hypothetical protein
MFWVGVVIDGVAAAALLAPADSPIRGLAYPGVLGSNVDYADGTRSAFPLMLGWTLLLAWGARRPIERRMLLPLTVPVVGGFMAVEFLDIHLGHAALAGTVPTFMLQSLLVAGLSVAYMAAGRLAAGEGQAAAG